MKDWLLSIFGEWFVRRHLSRFGKMTSFHLDTHHKKISGSAELRGEPAPIEFEISYERFEQNGAQALRVTDVKVSREWMEDVAKTMLQQSPQVFPVPPGLLSLAVKILNI